MASAGRDEETRIKVLIVDDHAVVAQSLVRLLEESADIVVVGTAGTVQEAVSEARLREPDVILLDWELPDGTGADAARRIKHDRPETQIVVLTGFADEPALVTAIESGCSGFLEKTQAPEMVVAAVRSVHRGEALLAPAMLMKILPRLSPSYRRLGADLTTRELEILRLLSRGLPNEEIATQLSISLHTVRNHIQAILRKLRSHSKLEAVATAVREGLVRYP